jgi:polyketide cyclase/dehydrase/lipid transport protein
MASESRHLSIWIERPADKVYAYASDPANVPSWAPGLTSHIEQVDGTWFIDMGGERAAFAFAEPNVFGVLDHTVEMPSGEIFYNPMRVIPAVDGSEVFFTVRRASGVSDEDFERDCGLVQADLERLKRLVEDG